MKYEIFIREDKKPAPFYKKAIAEYEKRLGRYCKISYKLVRKEKDWLKLMAPEPDRMAFWVVAGKDDLSSEGLSRMIADWENSGVKKIIFLVDQPAEESEDSGPLRSSCRVSAQVSQRRQDIPLRTCRRRHTSLFPRVRGMHCGTC